jgi:hypothetical protein
MSTDKHDERSGQGPQQPQRGLEQPGHQGPPRSGEQREAAEDPQLLPPETPFPPGDDGAPTRDTRHQDARTAMTGESPGG